ncbi:MAG: hypothetical protein K2Z81_01105, partial [Cyanobacteria bacterium]|nr:hypothetical protein [Cyanobacteriota bacterium]
QTALQAAIGPVRREGLQHVEQAEKEVETPGSRSVSSNISQIRQDLARMHHELQFFIAESLSSGRYLLESDGAASFEEPYLAYGEVEKSLEADLASVNQKTSAESAFKTAEPLNDVSKTADGGKLWSVYDEPATHFGIFDESKGGVSGVFLTHHQSSPQQRIGIPADVSQILESFERIDDELENLAERAFVISPRLGPTEEPGLVKENPRQVPPPIIPKEPTPAPAEISEEPSVAERLFPGADAGSEPEEEPIPPPRQPESLDSLLNDLLDDTLVQRMATPVTFDEIATSDFWETSSRLAQARENSERQDESAAEYDDELPVTEPEEEEQELDTADDQFDSVAQVDSSSEEEDEEYSASSNQKNYASYGYRALSSADENDQSQGYSAAPKDDDTPISSTEESSDEDTSSRSEESRRFPPPKRGGEKKSTDDLSGGPPPKRRKS